MVVTAAGMVTDCSDQQSLKPLSPMDATAAGRSMVRSDLQPREVCVHFNRYGRRCPSSHFLPPYDSTDAPTATEYAYVPSENVT